MSLETIGIGLFITIVGTIIADEIGERRKRGEPVFERLAHFIWDVAVAVATAIWDFIQERL